MVFSPCVAPISGPGEPWLAEFFRASTAGMAILDPELNFVRVNDTLAAMNGRPAAQHVGRALRDVLPKLGGEIEPLIRRVMRTGEPSLDVEIVGETPATPGVVRSWRASYFPLRASTEELVGVGAVIVETTRAKQAEGQVRLQASLLDQVHNAVLAADEEWRITYMNRHAEALFQWRAEELMGQPVDVLIAPQSAKFIARIRQRTAGGEKWQGECVLRKRDGVCFPALGSCAAVHDPVRGMIGVVGVAVDISEAKRAAQEIITSREQMRALAKRLNSTREEETRRIARDVHDVVGQQLSALKFELQRLEGSSTLDPKTMGQVRRIAEVADRALEATQEIASELRLGHLDLVGLGGAITWRLRQFAARTGIAVDREAVTDMLGLDRERAVAGFRIFQEALTNVTRHANATCVRVSLGWEESSVVLIVADNGRGITAREISSPQSIGLLGMRERAQALGGSLLIETPPAGGTQVVARLPEKPSESP